MAKRLNVSLPYDLVFLALADEEAGGAEGARFLTSKHPELLRDIAFVMNEGGGIIELPDGQVAYQVEVAQKAPLWLRLTARGPAGHGAAPSPDAAPARLARGLVRLADHAFPVQVLPPVQELYARKAASLPEALRDGAKDLRAALQRPAYREAFLRDPHHAALVRNTLAITMLHGSDKENVIPGEASAVLDMRLLPGQEADAVREEVKRVLADPAIELETLLSWTAYSTGRDTPLFHAIEAEAQRRDPGAAVMANVIGGFTDCNAFRALNIACYGFMPLRLTPDAFAGIHGNDERVKVSTLGDAVVSWVELLRNVSR
jgi:acetylornithine deacetylase/succinyl-diaminopimelate desuccinylase-like protein